MNKAKLIEEIETKIEEFRENVTDRVAEWGNYFEGDNKYDEGAIAGLTLALGLVRELPND